MAKGVQRENRDLSKGLIVFGTTVGMSADLFLRGQLSWFRQQGWGIALATSPDEAAMRAAVRERVQLLKVPMAREISLRADLRALLHWIRLLQKLRPIAVNLASPKVSLLGGLAAKFTRVPRRVYVVWGLRLEHQRGFLAMILWLMERLTIALATDIVVVSRSLGDQLVRKKLVSAHKLWLIEQGSSNGVDSNSIMRRVNEIQTTKLRRRLDFEPEAFVVGYVGRINYHKGVKTLIDAFLSEDLNPNIELLMIGTIEDEELSEAIEALEDRVTIIPWTSDVWGHFPAMDVLCLPTLREGFPNVVLEAAAAGLPTVTTNATGAVDSVVDGKTGLLFNMGDVTQLIERLNVLASNPGLVEQMGKSAQQRAKEEFNPVRVWQGIEAVLEQRYDHGGLRRISEIGEGH